MIEERKRWWDAVEYRISKAPLQLQQSLHFIVKHIREDEGGATACCGTFLPHFVDGLPYRDAPISEQEAKQVMKILRRLRLAVGDFLDLPLRLNLDLWGSTYNKNLSQAFSKL